jgi:hypothetical protein
LNLQHRCRVVVNLELPWNPVRLAQRTGRVDRIGQQRRVHTFHLVAFDAGERLVADRLDERTAVAHADLAQLPVERLDVDTEVARLLAVRVAAKRGRWMAGGSRESLADARRPLPPTTGLVAIVRRAAVRKALGASPIIVLRSALVDRFGRATADRLIAVRVGLAGDVPMRSRAQVRALLAAFTSIRALDQHPAIREWVEHNTSISDAFWRATAARVEAIAAQLREAPISYRQQLLFTRHLRDDRPDAVGQASSVVELRLKEAGSRRPLELTTTPLLLLLA